MAGNVTGNIGNEYVELNNAATESTLQDLVRAITGNSQQVKNLANKSGIKTGSGDDTAARATNNRTVAENTGVFKRLSTFGQGTADSFKKLDDNISPLIGDLIKGSASITVLTNRIGELNPLLGVAANLFGKLIKYQEENFKSYETMTNAGVNFSGSLTDLRMAAASSYLTLTEFGNLIAKNSDAFSRMGGTANEGAIAFSKASNDIFKSSLGDNLRALGYTSDQVNQGLVNYIAMTGGRTAQEMKSTDKLTKGAGEYLKQLDALAEITGKSRESQEEELKQLQANQAFQAYLQTLDVDARDRANAGLAEAMARGGKGAAEALQAKIMGVSPGTKAGQMFTAIGQNASISLDRMAANVTDSTKTVADQQRLGASLTVDIIDDISGITSQTIFAINATGGELAGTLMAMQGTANQAKSQGVKTIADAEAQLDSVQGRQRQREQSQAATMAESDNAMKRLTAAVIGIVNPIVDAFMPAITFTTNVVTGLAVILENFGKTVATITALIVGGIAVGGVISAFKKKGAAGAAGKSSAGKGLFGGLGPLGTKDNPMYVIIAGSGGVAESIADSVADAKSGGNKGTPKEKSQTRQNREKAADKLKSIKSAGTLLKGLGIAGTLVGAVSALSEIGQIEKDLAKGKITKEAARSQEGGVAGELAGGAAGGWVGGAYGAALGTMLLPGIGTVIGGAIGAMAGGFGGGYLGGLAGKELGKSSVTDKISEKPAGESYVANADQQIIDLLTKQHNESEKIRILQQKSNSHLDDIKSLDDFNKLKLK